ncbi:hypothetical protein BDV37DRAFT_261723, partial [Aspergillus pseudonomiae]
PFLYWSNRVMESANNFPELLETCGIIYQSGTSSTATCASNTPTHNRMPFFTAAQRL